MTSERGDETLLSAVDVLAEQRRRSEGLLRLRGRRAEPGAAPAGGVAASSRRAWYRRGRVLRLRRSLPFYLMMLLPLAFLIIFNYWPMIGAQIAFRNYSPVTGIWGSPWTGLYQFKEWIENPDFWPVMRNTLVLSVYALGVGTPITLLFALALNEVRHRRYKRFVQSVSFFPFFISTVVLVGMMDVVLAPDLGLLPPIFHALGLGHPPDFFGSNGAFPSLYVWSGVWQTTGYGAIIYLGALSNVDPQLYEAARLDGATILQKIRYVDWPTLRPTFVILLILSLGGILAVGFEKVYLLQNPLNLGTSQVISTYVYEFGLTQANFSFGSAVGLFNSVISLILILCVNRIAQRVSETSLF